MQWRGQREAIRPRRPTMRRLTTDERDKILGEMTREIARSPVLTAFSVQVQPLKGRFYLEWFWTDEPSTWGRITPLEDSPGKLLLEVEHRKGRWSEVATGAARRLIAKVAGDTRGTFHGLGSLDKSLRLARKQGLEKLAVRKVKQTHFIYEATDQPCTVQEALYHYFGLPIPVIAQPVVWYSRYRTPQIVESSDDRTRVLVRFLSWSMSGEVFGGTCLYVQRNGEWEAYTIRPNQSHDIATAERWLSKRKWKSWC